MKIIEPNKDAVALLREYLAKRDQLEPDERRLFLEAIEFLLRPTFFIKPMI